MRILITGGTGSFGRAFIAHVLQHDLVTRIYSFSFGQELRYRLRHEIPDPRLTVIPGDVTRAEDFDCVPAVDVVIHAAAEKHIDTGEDYPGWVWRNNVDGAERVIACARARGAKLIALSTDKACNPLNAYGRSKAAAERFVTAAGGTCVRYGNVIGSSGSVVPLFIDQRKQGRVTVTDRRMTRYFMPLAPGSPFSVQWDRGRVWSAVELVLFAIEHGQPGEILIPQIPSGSVQQLAEKIAPGCVIEEIGIRPGEKLHEELIAPDEACYEWPERQLYVLSPEPRPEWHTMPVGFAYTSAAIRPLEEIRELCA